ncbi:uncharacterized protein LOC113239931 [Hyposmocoma kahamanoa]|uniref:uncharacterized protein LOC113239931 n=1 Tax=Hyposmocoma kahamanoa TaxID=1477025 RepID=UPI000E6D5C69|nr:uncharacterized protein LOC113239931 [Hyposmocoma kahamanoa]
MAQYEEPMDIDSSVCDFDNKENAFQHSNVLPRTPCTEKGYEELDVSELNMKLRYSTTPTLSPMSKSYTANCLDNRTFDSGNNVVDNGSLTRSMNSAITKNDSVRQQMCLPLQIIPAEQGHMDTNRNALRPLDSTVTLDNDVVIAVSTPNDIDENLSLPSSASSIVHTPEATTPSKGELKDGDSTIMRGLKSVLNIFRPSQSPIPPVEDDIDPVKTETLSPPIVLSPESAAEKPQAVLASTPLSSQKSQDALTKRNSPNRDSLVFNEDLEKELQWKDETTIIFSKEKIPIHKLLFQSGKSFETKAINTKTNDENFDNTVEYMDISYNDSINNTLEVQPQNMPVNKCDAVANESDGEFVDCESTFTKTENQGDLSFKSQETLSEPNVVSLDGNSINELIDVKDTLNVTITSAKSDDLSVVSTGTVKDNTMDENMQKIDNVNENEGASSLAIKNMENCAQVHPTKSSLPVDIGFKQVVPDMVANVSVTLDQNDTFNVEKTTKKDCIDSIAKVNSNTENNIAIVTNRNEKMLNGCPGISSLSQIPLIIDPRVLLFNISSEDTPNTAQANTVDEEKSINDGLDTTPADIPLPDDDDTEKVFLEGVIGVTEQLSKGEINHLVENIMPTSTESASRFKDEGTLNLEKTYCAKPERHMLDMVQVSNEVATVIESAITAVEQIVKGTENQDAESIIINDSISAAPVCSDLNETNIILNAIENVANEITSIPQGENTPVVCSSSTDIVEDIDIVEELQRTIEKLESEGKSSTTLDKSRVETSVAVNVSNNTKNEVKENSKQNEDNFISVLPDILAPEDSKLVNSVDSDINFTKNLPMFEFHLAAEVKIDNIMTENQMSLGDKIEIGDDVIHQKFKRDTFIESTVSNIIVENKESITQNVAVSVCVTEDEAIKYNDFEHNIVKDNNITSNEDIITPTDEITDMSKQIPDSDVNILSSLVTTAPIAKLAAEKTENVAISEEVNSEQSVLETFKNNQGNNEEPMPEDKLADSGTAKLQADNNNATDEEIVASANNSPFVSVSANFEEILEEKRMGCFEKVIPVEINEEIRMSPPSSPKIVSKGYNLNFDDIEDPFATKARIRMSPPLGVTPNQSFDQTNDTDIGKKSLTKKDCNREKRKSQPLRKKPSTINNKNNATFSGSSKATTEKSSKPLANKINAKEIKPINKDMQPTVHSIEIDGTLSESKNTPAELQDLGAINKVSVSVPKVEDVVSIDVNLTEEISNSEKGSIIDELVESEVQREYKTFANSATTVNEKIKNTTSSEHSAYYSAGTSSNEGLESKSSYNILDIKDTNFNPFISKSKVRQSPPPSLDNSFATKSSPDSSLQITKDTYIDGSIKKSPRDEEKNSSNSINDITSSSKNTDKVNTEDEDTIEGPFLETEELVDDNKVTESEAEILINNKKIIDISGSDHDDMLQFSDLPTTDEGVADAGELFIDAEAFEFLLNQNQNNAVADNGKESLFLKFDPLFAKRVSSDSIIATFKNVQKRQSTPQKTAPTPNDVTFIAKFPAPELSSLNVTNELDAHDTTEESIDDLNITVAKPMMVVNPAVNSMVTPRTKAATPVASNRRSLTFTSPAIAVIDRLLSLSANNSAIAHETTIAEVSRDQNEADLALTQLRELLADKEINVYTLRSEAKELKDRLSDMESQVKSLEATSEERLKKINELTKKLDEKTKHNKSMAMVVEEYERTIASLIAEKEQDKKRHADERSQLIRERDEQTAHLASMEVSFSDLHSKYEKSKQIILGFKTNEEAYKKSIKEFEDNLSKMQNNYELLKQHATSKLNHANEELQKINRAHEAEVLKLNAMIKRKELHITSLEETVSQKTKANEELTAICDELINKVSSR